VNEAGQIVEDASNTSAAGVTRRYFPGLRQCRLRLAQTLAQAQVPVQQQETWLDVLSRVNVYKSDRDGITSYNVVPEYTRVTDERQLIDENNLTGARVIQNRPITYDANGRRLFGPKKEAEVDSRVAGGSAPACTTCEFKTYMSTGSVAHQCVRQAGASGFCSTHSPSTSPPTQTTSPTTAGAATAGADVSGDTKMGGKVTVPLNGESGRQLLKWPILNQAETADLVAGLNSGFANVDNKTTVGQLLLQIQSLKRNDEFIFYVSNDDGYGQTSAVVPKPFVFSLRHKPIRTLTDRERKYLEWLMDINGVLRHDDPDYNAHLLDLAADTIGILETAILTTLGRLEKADVEFKRSMLFEGWRAFDDMMHPDLREYASRPPVQIWMSPLSTRYTYVPNSELNEAFTGSERNSEGVAIVALNALQRRIVDAIQGKTDASNSVDQRFVIPTFNAYDVRQASQTYPQAAQISGLQSTIVGVMEDNILAILARLQAQYNLLVPRSIFRLTDPTMKVALLYAHKELQKYIDAIPPESTGDAFIDLGSALPIRDLSMYIRPASDAINADPSWNPLMAGQPVLNRIALSSGDASISGPRPPYSMWTGGNRGGGQRRAGGGGRSPSYPPVRGGSRRMQTRHVYDNDQDRSPSPPVQYRRRSSARTAGCAPCRPEMHSVYV